MDQDVPGTPHRLDAGETLQFVVATEPDIFTLTSHRVIVGSGRHTALDVSIDGIRRLQFDIEVGRRATLVVVPHQSDDYPQVLEVPHEELEVTTRALYMLGHRLREQR